MTMECGLTISPPTTRCTEAAERRNQIQHIKQFTITLYLYTNKYVEGCLQNKHSNKHISVYIDSLLQWLDQNYLELNIR